MNKYKNRNSCDFFTGACLIRIYEISNDDLFQCFEIVLYNNKRFVLKKYYNDKEYSLYYENSKIFVFSDIMDAVAYIINSNDVF